MTKKWKVSSRVFVSLLAIALVVGMAFMAVAEDSVTTIKLGAINPLADITGAQMSKAMQLAVDEINAAGGVLGRPLELIVIDSEFDPAKGAAAIEKLATVDNVDVFIGGMASGVHMGEIPILKKYEKVTVWAGSAMHLCEEALEGCDWYFHLHPWDYQQGASYVQGWADIVNKFPEVQINNAFWAYEEGAFGSGSFAGSVALHTNWNNSGESFKSAALGGGDYSAVLQHAKAANPDIFVWIGYAADALPIMEQSTEIGFNPPLFVGSPPGWPADFGQSPLAENVVAYGMWAPSIKNISEVSNHFWNAYIEKFDEEPATYFCPLGYTNVYVVAEAIARAGSLEKEALILALEETAYDSPLGEILTFTPSNVIKHQGFQGQKILQWQNGEQQVIWPFDYATAGIVYPFTGN